MKKAFLLLFLTLSSCLLAKAQHGKYVGGDISDLLLYEEHNSPYLDEKGQKIDDLITWLVTECGWNSFRVRLFVDPNGMSNDGSSVDPSVCQDLEYVKKLGKRIKAAGAKFLLDIHYSDTWVDATHIQAPAAWKSLTTAKKITQLGTYTTETLQALNDAGATPDMVQVGNEIMYGFVGVKVSPYDNTTSDWTNFLALLKAGCDAVRATCPNAEIIIHTDRPCNAAYNKYWYGKLDKAEIDYDVIGLSYYPFWHGLLSELKTALNSLKTDFPNKKVQIVETGYYFQYWPTGNNIKDTRSVWPASETGQYNFVKDLVTAMADYEQVEGLFYWCPEDAGNGDDTDWNSSKGTCMTSWTNRGLWWPSSSKTGHWPVTCTQGFAPRLMKNFLDPKASSDKINAQEGNNAPIYDVFGRRVDNPKYKGIYIQNGKKAIIR